MFTNPFNEIVKGVAGVLLQNVRKRNAFHEIRDGIWPFLPSFVKVCFKRCHCAPSMLKGPDGR